MSAAVLADTAELDSPPWASDASCGEVDSCPACGHPNLAHRILLTQIASFMICHELTEYEECYRVRHAQGIPFGACWRDTT